MKKTFTMTIILEAMALVIAVVIINCLPFFGINEAFASDHDDGEIDLKGRSLNLTDVYAFREDSQTGNAADADNLIVIMNSNPRSLARQQYFFSSQARYEFHISRASSRDAAASGADDVLIRITFSEPNPLSNLQIITLTAIKDGVESVVTKTTSNANILTTSLAQSTDNIVLTNNQLAIGGTVPMTLFAGHREDPFFFDVEQFFRVRAFALGFGPAPSPLFKPASKAVDFAAGYNVNSLVLRLPISYLQSSGAENVFDVWATVSIPN